jgi:GntR family transcriptional regulator of gluconate operon
MGPTLADEAATQLRERILDGKFRLGERLVESRLANDLGISRGTVRQALAQLRAEDLVEEHPRRGTFVVRLTAEDVVDIFDFRAGLETTALRLALERNRDALIARLDEVVARMDRAADADDLAELTSLDVAFHEAICVHSDNRRLLAAFHTLVSLIRLLVTIEEREHLSPDAVVGEHRALLEGVRAGDVADAQRLIIEHFDGGKVRLGDFARSLEAAQLS